MIDRKKLTKAFAAMRKTGIFARQNWQCCNSCGCAAIPEDQNRYAFYHAQDTKVLKRSNTYSDVGPLYITFGSNTTDYTTDAYATGEAVTECLRAAGLKVEWDEDTNTRIAVLQE